MVPGHSGVRNSRVQGTAVWLFTSSPGVSGENNYGIHILLFESAFLPESNYITTPVLALPHGGIRTRRECQQMPLSWARAGMIIKQKNKHTQSCLIRNYTHNDKQKGEPQSKTLTFTLGDNIVLCWDWKYKDGREEGGEKRKKEKRKKGMKEERERKGGWYPELFSLVRRIQNRIQRNDCSKRQLC